MKNQLSLNFELYKKLYLCRMAEKKIIEEYRFDEMKTPMHMSMGGEAIAVGICHAIGPDGQVFTSYRSHAVYLAKTMNLDGFFAELYAKDTAFAKGKAGSMHLSEPSSGAMGASAIVGSVIPVAVGAAFANKKVGNNRFVSVFFGDGAIDEGVFWESLNLACLMQLPILFVCEDNELSVHTSKSERHGYQSITDVVSKFNCKVFKEKTTDVEVIYKLTQEAMKQTEKTLMPSFLHLQYYRYLEHVGINEDFDAGYRSKNEYKEWLKVDPIDVQRQKLLRIIDETEVMKVERNIEKQIAESIDLAKKAPFANEEELFKGIFA